MSEVTVDSEIDAYLYCIWMTHLVAVSLVVFRLLAFSTLVFFELLLAFVPSQVFFKFCRQQT
jgi:hypothetical protein